MSKTKEERKLSELQITDTVSAPGQKFFKIRKINP